MPRTIILLSGGVDSTVMVALAHQQKKICLALSFDYGQKHAQELDSARAIAKHYNVPHTTVKIDAWPSDASALLSGGAAPSLPSAGQPIPNTYVPARNTLFMAYGLLYAELYDAAEIWVGSNADDIEPYPDCRPAFFDAFRQVASHATRQAVTRGAPKISTPLLHMTKEEVITLGRVLQAPLDKTFSCYSPLEGAHCGECLACRLRH